MSVKTVSTDVIYPPQVTACWQELVLMAIAEFVRNNPQEVVSATQFDVENHNVELFDNGDAEIQATLCAYAGEETFRKEVRLPVGRGNWRWNWKLLH